MHANIAICWKYCNIFQNCVESLSIVPQNAIATDKYIATIVIFCKYMGHF